MFKINLPVRLHLTDAAGVLFFGNYFILAHDAYESMMESIGFPLDHFVIGANYMPLIVHAEGDYLTPLRTGHLVTVVVHVEKIGTSSYALRYDLSSSDGATVAVLRTVHVTVDRATMQSCPIPDELRAKLTALAE
jgi:1,4-dihydroxy-2-naphthoyl-CoA hydrolase